MSVDTKSVVDAGDAPSAGADVSVKPLTAEGQSNFAAGLDDGDAVPDGKNEAALKAAEKNLADHGVTNLNQIEGRRHGGEGAAIETMGGDAKSLDRPGKPAFPTYDASSSNEVASVKTHWANDGSLSEGARANYQHDFEHMLGWGRTPDALQTDGKNIKAAAAEGVPVPQDLTTQGTDAAAGEWLRDNSVMRVPDDHVSTVRADLGSRARALPGNYFLPENPSDAQVTQLTERVKGIGVTSAQLQDLIDKRN